MTQEEAEAKVKELEAALTASKAEAEKAKKMAADGQTLIDTWKNEMGQSRKDIADAIAATKATHTAQTISTEAAQGGNDSKAREAEAQKLKEELDKRQANLTEEEGKSLDAAYESLRVKAEGGDPEAGSTIKRIHEDLAFRNEFLAAAASGNSLPASWRKEPAKTGAVTDDIKATVKKIFEEAKKQSSYIPPGSYGGENASAGRGAPAKNGKVPFGEWGQKYFPGRG